MPEHREGTPARFRLLESFVWHDLDDGPRSWAAWLRHRHIGASPDASAARALRLHAALRTMQAAHAGSASAEDESKAARALDRLIGTLGVRPRIEPEGGIGLTAADPHDPAAVLLIDALDAMRVGVWPRFKLCREPTCRASFYDASKAGRKIWCEMSTCGSRNKMRRYRAKT